MPSVLENRTKRDITSSVLHCLAKVRTVLMSVVITDGATRINVRIHT